MLGKKNYNSSSDSSSEKNEKKTKNETNEQKGDFNNFKICQETQDNLKNKGIQYLFPIQVATFDHIYQKYDLIGKDRTGSGKTLAFSLPVLERLRDRKKYFKNERGQNPYILVLVPTRELAIQVTKEFERFKNYPKEYRVISVYGQTDIRNQQYQLKQGIEIIVGTPGRTIDLLNRGDLDLKELKVLVLDETDQMLDFGFKEDIEKVLGFAKSSFQQVSRDFSELQILLFSATVPEWVNKIAKEIMKPDLKFVDMIKNQEVKTSKTVEHYYIKFANKQQKISSIGDIVMTHGGSHSRTIIFTEKKTEANEVHLNSQLKVESQVLHGDIPQKQREVVFESFRSGKLKCMIATNVAARGLDIRNVDLIIQLQPPPDIDSYIHRSGRTGRAGKSGTCITLITRYEKQNLQKIERQAKIKIKKIGVPQIQNIMQANARDISLGFDKVSQEVLPYFEDTVDEILKKYNAKEALSRALALTTGYTNMIKQRSLLFSAEGFITFMIEASHEIRSSSYFWNVLKRYFAPEITDSIKGMTLLQNKMGVVFDLPAKHKDIFLDMQNDLEKEGFKISQPTELPEIQERQDNDRYSNGRSYGQDRNNRSYGNRRDSNRGYGGNRDNGRSYGGNRDNGRSHGGGRDNQSYGRDRRNNDRDNRSSGRDYNNNDRGQKRKNYCKLFVANLPFDIVERDLEDLFKKNNFNPNDIYIVKDQDKKSKGFGYVQFREESDAKEAYNVISRERMNGRQLKVDYADERNQLID